MVVAEQREAAPAGMDEPELDVGACVRAVRNGDEAAARSITDIEIPAQDDYLTFYNPGGPGPTPFPDVRYTAPGPPDLEPVTIALDNPMRVSAP